MDTSVTSSLLAILLFAVLGCADAWGTVQYFNASKTQVRKGEVILFKCGTTLEQTDGGQAHSLIVHIKKWFPSSSTGWTLTTNEEVVMSDSRMDASLRIIQQNDTQENQKITEVDFTIRNAEPGDSGNYTCYTKRNNVSTFVDVVSEPYNVELYVDGVLVGQMEMHDLQSPVHVRMNEEVDLVLGQSYTVNCVVQGGHPPPDVRLSSGNMVYRDVVVTVKSRRNPDNWSSEPNHEMNASMTWTATVKNIGMPLRCESSVEEPEPIYTNFVPVVSDRQPLFDCADKIVAASNQENLGVTCRIISMKVDLDDVTVRVFVGDEKNFTISLDLTGDPAEQVYPEDQRYVLTAIPIPTVRYSWNVTFTIKDARRVADLYKHRLEYIAVNPHDVTDHTVVVEAEGPSSASRMTMSMVVVLFTMVLGAFY